jgi:hypothetical protein
MSRKTHIAPVEAEPLSNEDAAQTVADAPFYPEDEWVDAEDAPPARSIWGWLLPSLALALVLGWTAFFGWVHQQAMLTGAAPSAWAGWVSDWSTPVLLVGVVWLLAMRNSRREASRFADAGQSLALEAARLEERLTTVNRELSLAREFITAQSRDLESFGRMASERLSENADRLQTLVHDNAAQVESIASVSTTALENMDRLRSDLPVIANSARDTANQIGNAGRTAHKQLETMIEGMDRLNQFGKASEQQVALVRQRVDDALSAFEAQAGKLEQIAEGRFAELSSQGEAFRALLDSQEIEALAAVRRRAEALFEELQATRSQLDAQENESLEKLRDRITLLRDEGSSAAQALSAGETSALANARDRMEELLGEITRFEATLVERNDLFNQHLAERRAAAAAQDDAALAGIEQRMGLFDQRAAELRDAQKRVASDLAEQGEQLAARLAQLHREMEDLSSQGGAVRGELAESIRSLGEALANGRQSLVGTEQQISILTDASVRLLELIHASAQHSQDVLPAALDDAERKLADFRQQAENLGEVLGEAAEKVSSARREGQSVVEECDAFYGRLMDRNREHIARLAELRSHLSDLSKENEDKVTQASEQVSHAIADLQQSTRDVVEELISGTDQVVAQLTGRISGTGAEAIDRIMQDQAAIVVGKLEAAAGRAAMLGHDAAVQLRDQLARVDELASNLEARVVHARQQAEEQVDNDFSRRVALITESLNSNAIDIAKALSNDVTDKAWASYLKGDRGVFTRRAVRLVDNSESRIIAEIYENDPDFREHVSRYVHDFEAMMRTLLSTRDGHALCVTLLSSDMGKLYVVLAQSIERLRN